MKNDIVTALMKIANNLERIGEYKSASEIDVIIKEAQVAYGLSGLMRGRMRGAESPREDIESVPPPQVQFGAWPEQRQKELSEQRPSYAVKNIPSDPRERGKFWGKQWSQKSDLPRAQQMVQAKKMDADRLERMSPDDPKFAALRAKHQIQYVSTPQELAQMLRDQAAQYEERIAFLQQQDASQELSV